MSCFARYLEIIGYIFMAPSLYGVVYFCCPTRAQRDLRSQIMARRRVRHKLFREDFKKIEVFTDVGDKYAQREAAEKAKRDAAVEKSQARSGAYKV